MKIIRHFFTLSLLFIILSGCEKYFEGVNENPNAPTNVLESVLLTGIEVEIADLYGGEMTRFTGMLTQQFEGASRCGAYYYYTGLQPAEFSTLWQNTYANILNEVKILKEQSNEKGLNHVEGVANVLLAFQLLQSTDVWGAIPWTEALQGVGNMTPKFDSQESIYAEINTLLEDAIQLFEQADGGIAIGGDLIYNGEVENWKKAAYALTARAAIRWGDWEPDSYNKVLTALQSSFTSNADDMVLAFPGTGGNEAPMYRFNDQRAGHLEFNPGMEQIMTALNDTIRVELFNPPFYHQHPYYTKDYVQPLITYREMKFLEAECLIRTNGSAQEIHDAYLEGISASFQDLDLDNNLQDYIQQSIVDPGVGNITLEDVWMQKYIGLFGLPEVYNDFRRTGFPNLQPVRGEKIPVRFPYPEAEVVSNPNTPNISIFDNKVRWDVQ